MFAGFAMYDTIKHVKNDVSTINVGLAASAGALVLSAGTKGKRFVLPTSYSMIHQVIGGVEGQATDIEITAKHVIRLREDYARMLSDNTDQDIKKVLSDIERDNWMSAQETIKYGLADKMMETKK